MFDLVRRSEEQTRSSHTRYSSGLRTLPSRRTSIAGETFSKDDSAMSPSDFYSQRLNEKFTSLLPETHLLSDVIVVPKNQRVVETWQIMKEKGIFGIPVVDPTTKRAITLINMFNFTAYFLDHESPRDVVEILESLTTEDLMGYRVTNLLPIKQVSISFRKTCSLLTKSGCHSVSLMKNKKLDYLITRASVIRFIADNSDHWGDYLRKKVTDVVIGNKNCSVVKNTSTVREAFQLMCDKLIGGIGVVNDDGVLIGGMSIRAISCFTEGNLQQNLSTPIGEFLAKKVIEGCDTDVLCVRDTDPLTEVIKKLARCKVYRVFIIDDSGKPTGIVSLTDVLRYIANIDAARDQKLRKVQEKQELEHYRSIAIAPPRQTSAKFVEGVSLPYPIGSKSIGRKGNEDYMVGWATMQGWRACMEDAHLVMIQIENHPGCGIFGVFDGHGGAEVSRYLADNIGQRIAALPDMFDEEALTKVCIDLDEEYLNMVGGPESPKNQGSTAVVTIAKKLDNGNYKILNINVGDSRIILARRLGHDKYEAVGCTSDQNGHSRTERKRVREAGGFLSKIDRRVDGMLSVTRAFGDPWFKVPFDAAPENRKVIAIPAFTSFEVRKGDFLLLTCDGLYEAQQREREFKRKTLVDWVGSVMPATNNLGVVCGSALNECLLRGSNDNMSAMIVKFEDGSDYPDSVKFIPGPYKIPKQLKPRPDAQRIFQCAYMENAREYGYSLAEARAIRKKLSPSNKLRL
eukprot:TRINITY_DN17018_c0_g1_i1.p1 TRINITY_DN17018_c0_g1~~TRINITY_DN17018_c0_g1_i1.p1  ORF type:complete len:741 (+),score=107.61 TRINITY_DN17018_c0_g1_i1:34-2256(+)